MVCIFGMSVFLGLSDEEFPQERMVFPSRVGMIDTEELVKVGIQERLVWVQVTWDEKMTSFFLKYL